MAREKNEVTWKTFAACVAAVAASYSEEDTEGMGDEELQGKAYGEVLTAFREGGDSATEMKKLGLEHIKANKGDGKTAGKKGRTVSKPVAEAIRSHLTAKGDTTTLAAFEARSLPEKQYKQLLQLGRSLAAVDSVAT